MTLADSGRSRCRDSFPRQGGAVYIASGQGGASCVVIVLHSGGVNVSVPDQGAVCRDQGGAGVRFHTQFWRQ